MASCTCGAGRLGCSHAAAEFHGLHCLQAHQRLREQAVETLVPVGVGADAGRQAVNDDLEDAADGVAGAERLVDLGLHGGFGFGVGAGEQKSPLSRYAREFVEVNLARELGGADADDVAHYMHAEFAQQQLGQRAAGYTCSGLARWRVRARSVRP